MMITMLVRVLSARRLRENLHASQIYDLVSIRVSIHHSIIIIINTHSHIRLSMHRIIIIISFSIRKPKHAQHNTNHIWNEKTCKIATQHKNTLKNRYVVVWWWWWRRWWRELFYMCFFSSWFSFFVYGSTSAYIYI